MPTKSQKLDRTTLAKLIKEDPDFRRELALGSFQAFFTIYFAHYIKVPSAFYHFEMFRDVEDLKTPLFNIIGHRGSAKTSIFIVAAVIWRMIARDLKCAVVLGYSGPAAKAHLRDLRTELEENELLIADFGPFHGRDSIWTSDEIVVKGYNCLIAARGSGQNVRGVKNGAYRPQLIIGDDIESLESVRTRDRRNKTFNWFTGDVIESGWDDSTGKNGTQVYLLGNLLHSDSIMSRMKNEIVSGNRDGVHREYPLIKNGVIQWPGRYPDMDAIEKKRRQIGKTLDGDRTWKREYLLKIVPEQGQPVRSDQIMRYENLPGPDVQFITAGSGLDLAVGEKQSNDATGMVSGRLYFMNNEMRLYVLPNPLNERINPLDGLGMVASQSRSLNPDGIATMIFGERVTMSEMFLQALQREGIPVEPMSPGGNSKRARLLMAVTYILSGQVLFPENGCEDLMDQLLGFGVEPHDDLVDALVYLILGMFNMVDPEDEIQFVR